MNQPLLQWWHFSFFAAAQQQKLEQKQRVQQSRSKKILCATEQEKKNSMCRHLRGAQVAQPGTWRHFGIQVPVQEEEGELDVACPCCLINKTNP